MRRPTGLKTIRERIVPFEVDHPAVTPTGEEGGPYMVKENTTMREECMRHGRSIAVRVNLEVLARGTGCHNLLYCL